MAKNYRVMRYRQTLWAIFDCDEKGRPITMTPVFSHQLRKPVLDKLDELQKADSSLDIIEEDAEAIETIPMTPVRNNSSYKKHQKSDKD